MKGGVVGRAAAESRCIENICRRCCAMPQKKCNFVAKFKVMGANSSCKAMYDIVEQAKDGTILFLMILSHMALPTLFVRN